MKIIPYYDRADIVGSSVDTVLRALLEGACLVFIVLYILLRNVRGAIVVITALPLSLLVTFIAMKTFGLSANLMSLGGLAISIGMIIDATIIQVENVQRHLGIDENRKNKLSTVLNAVLEVRKPSILGELIIVLTFLPILSLEGMEGKMFQPLALTVAIAIFSSLLLSIFVIPVLCSLFLSRGRKRKAPSCSLCRNGICRHSIGAWVIREGRCHVRRNTDHRTTPRDTARDRIYTHYG